MIDKIFHNPAGGTSRKALAVIRASGEVPAVIDCLSAPPSPRRPCLPAAMQGGEVIDTVAAPGRG